MNPGGVAGAASSGWLRMGPPREMGAMAGAEGADIALFIQCIRGRGDSLEKIAATIAAVFFAFLEVFLQCTIVKYGREFNFFYHSDPHITSSIIHETSYR